MKEYFVFWAYSPIYGYLLTYVAEGHGEELGAPRIWNGGFLDVINHAAYDVTGKPLEPDLLVKNNSGIKEENRLTKLSLMIPKHKFSAEGNTLTLLCK